MPTWANVYLVFNTIDGGAAATSSFAETYDGGAASTVAWPLVWTGEDANDNH